MRKSTLADRARKDGLDIPKLHTFINNRITLYRGRASTAFEVVSQSIKETVDALHNEYPHIYATPNELPTNRFIDVPDYHSACVVMTVKGIPLNSLQAGPNRIGDRTVQLNPDPLERYRQALTRFVSHL